jgi:hypothetical protein
LTPAARLQKPAFLKLGGASGLWIGDNSSVPKAYRDAEELPDADTV